MKIIFVADIDNHGKDKKKVMTNKIECQTPSKVLHILARRGHEVPSLDKLLYHLFELRAAFAGRDYIITIRTAE